MKSVHTDSTVCLLHINVLQNLVDGLPQISQVHITVERTHRGQFTDATTYVLVNASSCDPEYRMLSRSSTGMSQRADHICIRSIRWDRPIWQGRQNEWLISMPVKGNVLVTTTWFEHEASTAHVQSISLQHIVIREEGWLTYVLH